jgi:hypothetical protein
MVIIKAKIQLSKHLLLGTITKSKANLVQDLCKTSQKLEHKNCGEWEMGKKCVTSFIDDPLLFVIENVRKQDFRDIKTDFFPLSLARLTCQNN